MSSSRPSSSSRSSSSKSGSSSSSSSPSSSSRSSKPKGLEGLREFEYAEYVKKLLDSHASYLSSPILALSAALEITALNLSIALGILYFLIHLFTPAFLLPHLSALVTLVIPVRNTLRSVATEQVRGGKAARDEAQWMFYWVIWGLFGLIGGGIGIWRPGWKAHYEIVRSAGLVTVGGPWFGRSGLRPDPPSEELKKAEKAEAEREAAREKQGEKDQKKESKEKEKAKKGAEADKAREKKGRDRAKK